MSGRFNSKQLASLSNFFFDIAKGVTLGAFSFTAISTGLDLAVRTFNFLAGLLLAYYCIRIGLYLVKDK